MLAPVNSKSLFHFVCGQMEKLDKKEITHQEAQAQANLAKQAKCLLDYELKRVQIQIQVEEHIKDFKTSTITLREIESKPFDNTI